MSCGIALTFFGNKFVQVDRCVESPIELSCVNEVVLLVHLFIVGTVLLACSLLIPLFIQGRVVS